MYLFLIISLITVCAFVAEFFKIRKIFIVLSIISIIFCYFLISKNFFHPECFYPSYKNIIYPCCCNYYNLVVEAIKDRRVYISTSKIYPKLESNDIYKSYYNLFFVDDDYKWLLDTSYYKGKIYLYFGIMPVLLFYLPFNILTGLYLTDKVLVFILGCISFFFVIIFDV